MPLLRRALVLSCFLAVAGPGAALAQDAASLQDVLGQCAACHGVDGIARSADVPNLAGQHDRYLFLQLQHFRSGKRAHKEMRYMSRQLTDAEMEVIARYYADMPH